MNSKNITIISTESTTITGQFGPFPALVIKYMDLNKIQNPFSVVKTQMIPKSSKFYKKNFILLTKGDYYIETEGRKWTYIVPLEKK